MHSKFLLLILIAGFCTVPASAQASDPVKSLGSYFGKWEVEGTRGTEKIVSQIECRWSPQGVYLVCDQKIKTSAGEHRQLTVYTYNPKESNYSYVTISEPGAKPTSGKLEIKGNVWTYPFSYESNGKTIQVRTINEFPDARSETFKTESSEDGGATWKTMLEGKAHKVGD